MPVSTGGIGGDAYRPELPAGLTGHKFVIDLAAAAAGPKSTANWRAPSDADGSSHAGGPCPIGSAGPWPRGKPGGVEGIVDGVLVAAGEGGSACASGPERCPDPMVAPSPQQRLDLALDLKVDKEKLDRLVASLAAVGPVGVDGLRVDAAALRLQSRYTGVEQYLLQISRVLNGPPC